MMIDSKLCMGDVHDVAKLLKGHRYNVGLIGPQL